MYKGKIMKNLYENLLDNVNNGNLCVMLTYLNPKDSKSGTIFKKILLTNSEIENKSIDLDESIYKLINESILTGKINQVEICDNLIIIEPFFPKPRLIIYGGGHVSKSLVEFASRVGFLITVIDDRPYFANKNRFPEADTVICEDFEKSFEQITFRKSDFVVIVTRGHRYDDVVLRRVLKHDLKYVGMIGSKRRVKAMISNLLEEGYSKEKLDSLNSPIGLDICAVTPDEVAISIVAELISYKNTSKKQAYPDFDDSVISEISKDDYFEKAILTILSSKGSVPRKAGAKMLSYMDGRTLGSIGGGCSEAEVLTKSREVMLNKGYLIEKVDMTGEVAESNGMVCGGIMDVLIEVL
jgi:xanthine dehydrogenase accessory factor